MNSKYDINRIGVVRSMFPVLVWVRNTPDQEWDGPFVFVANLPNEERQYCVIGDNGTIVKWNHATTDNQYV